MWEIFRIELSEKSSILMENAQDINQKGVYYDIQF